MLSVRAAKLICLRVSCMAEDGYSFGSALHSSWISLRSVTSRAMPQIPMTLAEPSRMGTLMQFKVMVRPRMLSVYSDSMI